MSDHRAVSRFLVVGFQTRVEPRRGVVAGQHEVVGHSVSRTAVTEGPHHGKLVHLAGQLWQVFAHLHAGDTGGDRVERTAEFLGGVGLQVPRVDRAQATGQEQDDQRVVVARGGLLGLALEDR